MNQIDTIKYLASVNSRSCYPKNLEDIDVSIPYFQIKKNNYDKYNIEGFGHIGHDNQDRMDYIINYLKNNIIPNVDKKCNLTGYYSIQLHDSYTYLNDNKNYKNVLTFSKFTDDNNPILIPDIYMISNWGNQLNNVQDPFKNWDDKNRRICMFGTTTGNRDPLLNNRIKTCLWSLNNRHFTDFYITNVAQMDIKKVVEKVPLFSNIFIKPVNINEQYKYAYQLIMDGNTCPFHCNSYFMNSLTFKYKSPEMLFYYPILQNNTHYVSCNIDNIETLFKYYENNKTEAINIINNANQFAKNWFNKPLIPQQYLVSLFENISNNK
jgi:hypothetical protein